MSKFRFMALQELAGHRPLEVKETAGAMPGYYGVSSTMKAGDEMIRS